MIPLLTETFLNYLKKLNIKNKKYLEIGSGDSTIYFSRYFKSVSSLEHDEEWFNKIKKQNITHKIVAIFKNEKITG